VKKADQITGAVLLAFSAFVVAESLRIPSETVAAGRTSFAPGAGFLPMWAGLVLAIFSIALIVTAMRRSAPAARGPALPRGPALVAVTLTALGLLAYVAAFERLGYLAATFLLNAYLLRGVMKVGWKSSLLTAFLASISLYVVFHVLLGIGLPRAGFAS